MTIAIAWILIAQGVEFRTGDMTETSWGIRGTTRLRADTELRVVAVRMERRWEAEQACFTEMKSDSMRLRASAFTAHGGRFEAALKAGPVGEYEVVVSQCGADEDTTLVCRKTILGDAARAFSAWDGHLKKLAAAVEAAARFVEEIRQFAGAANPPRKGACEDFLRRVQVHEQCIAAAAEATDWSACAALLVGIYYEIRNAQVWHRETPRGEAGNDSEVRKGVFLDPELTLDGIDKRVAEAGRVLGLEVRVSVAKLLAGVDSDLPGALRVAAKLVAAAPERDAEFESVFEERVASTRRDRLNAYVRKYVR